MAADPKYPRCPISSECTAGVGVYSGGSRSVSCDAVAAVCSAVEDWKRLAVEIRCDVFGDCDRLNERQAVDDLLFCLSLV